MPEEPQTTRSHVIEWDDPKPTARKARKMTGAEFFDAMRRGEVSQPPFGKLLGIDLFDVGEGYFAMSMQPQEMHYNPMGCVHGGILSTLLDSVMSAAVHTALPPGKGYLTLTLNVSFLRAVFEHTGEIMAEGNVVSMGHRIATAEGKITDSKGRICATGTATCLIMDGGAG